MVECQPSCTCSERRSGCRPGGRRAQSSSSCSVATSMALCGAGCGLEPRKACRLCPCLGRKPRARVGRELQSAPFGRGASCFMLRAMPSPPWRRFGQLSKLKESGWRKARRGSACPQLDHLPNEKWTHWDLNPGPSACEADVMPLHHEPHGISARICCSLSPVLAQRPVRRTFCYKLHGQLEASESPSPEFAPRPQTRMSHAQWPASARRAQSGNSAAGSQPGLLGESRASRRDGQWKLNQLYFGFPSGIIR